MSLLFNLLFAILGLKGRQAPRELGGELGHYRLVFRAFRAGAVGFDHRRARTAFGYGDRDKLASASVPSPLVRVAVCQ